MASGARARAEAARVQGFEAITLRNDLLSCTIIPELGGKISSLRDLRTGREWLWSNPSLPYRSPARGSAYVEVADTGGWDECYPTVAPCVYPLEPWKGLPIPDHGDLWSVRWQAEVIDRPEGAVTVRLAGPSDGVLPYWWRRDVTLSPGRAALHLDYRVTNSGAAPIAYIWSAHPLLAIEPGMRVQLPPETRLHLWRAIPAGLLPAEPDQRGYGWPLHVRSRTQDLDLSVVPDAAAEIAVKLWSEPLSAGRAALVAHDGTFSLTFDPALVPRIGLWLNAGGWSGAGGAPYYNLALEPCIGAQDSLEEAVSRYQAYRLLPPGTSDTWWLAASL